MLKHTPQISPLQARLVRLCLTSVIAFSALPALAQLGGGGAGSFPAERMRPAMDQAGILDVDTGSVGSHFDADGALWLG
ncbi:MAG: hypothetical protein GY822_06760, partial [Deltaproteobacteria bacterium]|nr:hypothetical protein [Deltaproteobacteria bacterium]